MGGFPLLGINEMHVHMLDQLSPVLKVPTRRGAG
jgi:hypothetical protein